MQPNRVVIIGNSGSGKSHLAEKLSSIIQSPIINLDKLFWASDDFSRKRDKDIVHQLILDHTKKDKWILEGVFGDLANVAISKADTLIFLNKKWLECERALLERGLQTATQENFNALLVWAEQYWIRKSTSSHEGHRQIFESFTGKKFSFSSREEVDDWFAHLLNIRTHENS